MVTLRHLIIIVASEGRLKMVFFTRGLLCRGSRRGRVHQSEPSSGWLEPTGSVQTQSVKFEFEILKYYLNEPTGSVRTQSVKGG